MKWAFPGICTEKMWIKAKKHVHGGEKQGFAACENEKSKTDF